MARYKNTSQFPVLVGANGTSFSVNPGQEFDCDTDLELGCIVKVSETNISSLEVAPAPTKLNKEISAPVETGNKINLVSELTNRFNKRFGAK
jgi:hypothetical protein